MVNIHYIQLHNIFQVCTSMIASKVSGFSGFFHPYLLTKYYLLLKLLDVIHWQKSLDIGL